MATVKPVITHITLNCVSFAYPVMANGDDGSPISAKNWTDYSDRSVQVTGTFGAAGNVEIEGSNENPPVNYAALNNAQGNALNITAESIKQIIENTLATRPRVTAGDGTTQLIVTFLFRRPQAGHGSA